MATVTAATDCVVFAILRTDLTNKMEEDVGFAARFHHSLAIFLAHRLRFTGRRLGISKGKPFEENVEDEDELSPEILDSVHMAASRFDRVRLA
jgi:CRP-like cAMP-binding protein